MACKKTAFFFYFFSLKTLNSRMSEACRNRAEKTKKKEKEFQANSLFILRLCIVEVFFNVKNSIYSEHDKQRMQFFSGNED
jgi:hypothetical protein